MVYSQVMIYIAKGMPLSKTGATHYYAELGLPEKGRAIKGLVFG